MIQPKMERNSHWREVEVFQVARSFVLTRRSSMYFDEDGDLAHEFYEETVVTKNGQRKAKLKRIYKNLTPQGIIKLDHPCIHVDFPVVLCEPG
uniref:Tumor suppressor 2, mitochondrial calcium regulator b n=2 Tax=Tetraodon nigroviridis TaxID=99883 RepID=H3DB35_TETNG